MQQHDGLGEPATVASGTCIVGMVAIVGATGTDKTAPILAFAGALIVAFIAAYTAKRRQDAALAAEAERHAATLRAQRERLDHQLAHDRRLKHDEVNRDALDDATQALVDAMRDASDYVRAAMLGQPDAADQELEWWDTFAAATAMHSRLQLRLGREHPACTTYDGVLKALRECATDVQELRLAGDRHPEIDARGRRGALEASSAYGDFIEAATAVVGLD